jgi:hypothetical protein
MIYIIGTAHARTQMWSDAIRNGECLDTDAATVEQFQLYLRDAAISLDAAVIAEELSQQVVEDRPGGASVAEQVAHDLQLMHLYCDPDRDERQKLCIKTGAEREAIWLLRLQRLHPNSTSIIFVCGADHCNSFKAMLDQNELRAQIYCRDWTLND